MNDTSPGGLARLKLIALMFLLPLVLALVGGWELHRVRNDAAAASSPRVQQEIADLQEMQRRVMMDMRTTIRVGDKLYAYGAARAHLQTKIDRLTGNSWAWQKASPQVITAFAVLAVVSGLAGMVLGVAGLAWATVAGRLARRSRDELVRVFVLSRQMLPFLLIGLVLCIVLALAGVTGAEGWRAVDTIAGGAKPDGQMRLYVILLVLGGMSLWAGAAALFNLRGAFAAFDVGPLYQHGRAFTASEAPGLWRHVESIAKVVRARPPQNIVVGLTEGFYATAHDVVVMPEERALRGETLYVPLTHAALLRPDEFSAIVGHELGHFVGEDTEYTRRFVPMYAGMCQSLDALQPHWSVTPARLLGEYLLQQIAEARMHWSREREFAADAVGMHVAGSRASARALVRSSAVSAITDDYLVSATAADPGPELVDLVEGLVDHAMAHGLSLPDGTLDHALPHPTDSHPPTSARLASLGEAPDERLLAEAMAPVDRRGLDLLLSFFPDLRRVSLQLSDELVRAPREAVRDELRRLADAGEPACDVFERTGPFVWTTGMAGLALAGVAVWLVLGPMLATGQADAGQRLLAGFVALPAVAALLASAWYGWRGRSPVLRLTPTGLDAPGLGAEVPWLHIATVNLMDGNGCLLEFKFELAAPVPELQHANLRRLRWKPKPRKLEFKFLAPRGMTAQALLDRVVGFIRADHARRELVKL